MYCFFWPAGEIAEKIWWNCKRKEGLSEEDANGNFIKKSVEIPHDPVTRFTPWSLQNKANGSKKWEWHLKNTQSELYLLYVMKQTASSWGPAIAACPFWKVFWPPPGGVCRKPWRVPSSCPPLSFLSAASHAIRPTDWKMMSGSTQP